MRGKRQWKEVERIRKCDSRVVELGLSFIDVCLLLKNAPSLLLQMPKHANIKDTHLFRLVGLDCQAHDESPLQWTCAQVPTHRQARIEKPKITGQTL